jgi:hypothetical protein
MKRSLLRTLSFFAELGTALAACLGCTPKPEPKKSPETINWKGHDSGYEGKTVVQPTEPASPAEPAEPSDQP